MVLVAGFQSREGGDWLLPLVRALPLAHSLEPGLLLVAGWSRAKIRAGSREPRAQWPCLRLGECCSVGFCVCLCVCVFVCLCVCGALETYSFAVPGNEGFQVWVPGRRVGVSPRLGVQSGSPEGRETRENPRGAQQAAEGVPGAELVLVSVSLACGGGELRHQRCAPSPSAASPKGRAKRRWRRREVRRDPWPPRCGL